MQRLLPIAAMLIVAATGGIRRGHAAPATEDGSVQTRDARLGRRYVVAQLDEHADDANPGTEDKPFKSINGCLKKVKADLGPGDTIFVKDGTYRETVSLIGPKDTTPGTRIESGASHSEMIRMQAYPGAKPVIKGSDVVTGWKTYQGNIWVKEDWDFNSQQVFVDGAILDQIGGTMGPANSALMSSWYPKNKGKGLGDMYAGSFYYDMAGQKLYAWLKESENPNKHLVEADARTSLISVGQLDYIGIGGFTLRHGSNNGYAIALSVNGRYCTVDNIDQAWHSFGGGFVGGEYITFSHCKFNHNGNNGMGGRYRGHRLLYCETKYNNYRNFATGWHAGGTKFVPACHDWVIKGHVSAYNNGDGIWFDGWMSNVTIQECTSYRNRGAGIHYEIGTRAVIKNNLLYENGMRGIYLSNASYSLVAHNLCYRNALSGIASIVAARKDKTMYTRGEEGLIPGGNNVVRGNMLVDNCWAKQLVEEIPQWDLTEDMRGSFLWLIKRYVTWGNRPELLMPEQQSGDSGSFSDYNLFRRGPDRGKPERLSFGRNWNVGYAYGLEDWRTKTGWDKHSIFAQPKFVNEAGYDFRPAEGCPSLWFVKKPDQAIVLSIDGVKRPGYYSPMTAGPYGGNAELFAATVSKMSVDKNLLCKLPSLDSVNRHKLTKIPYTLVSVLKKHYLTPVREGVKLNDIPFLMETRGVIFLTPEHEAKTVKLNWTAKQLYILFAAQNFEKQPFAKLVAHRDDGVSLEIDVRSDGKDGFAATALHDDSPAPVTLAWQGDVQYYLGKTRIEPAKVFMLTWTNDNPWLPISTIEFRLLDPKAAVAIVGISGESNLDP